MPEDETEPDIHGEWVVDHLTDESMVLYRLRALAGSESYTDTDVIIIDLTGTRVQAWTCPIKPKEQSMEEYAVEVMGLRDTLPEWAQAILDLE